MGNVYRFLSADEEYLYHHIRASNMPRIARLLDRKPALINQPLTKDCGSPPLNAAISQENIQVLQLLLARGADPNITDMAGRDAWMIAAYLQRQVSLNFLLSRFREVPTRFSKSGHSALDYAIIKCNRRLATKLLPHFKASTIKMPEQYTSYGQKNRIRYVNYKTFIQCLLQHEDDNKCRCDYFYRPEKVYDNPVVDTREGWLKFINRVAEFKPAPLVQRAQLKEEQLPENRRLGWLYQRLSGLQEIKRKNSEKKAASGNASNRQLRSGQ